jgi:hypothetical protein
VRVAEGGRRVESGGRAGAVTTHPRAAHCDPRPGPLLQGAATGHDDVRTEPAGGEGVGEAAVDRMHARVGKHCERCPVVIAAVVLRLVRDGREARGPQSPAAAQPAERAREAHVLAQPRVRCGEAHGSQGGAVATPASCALDRPGRIGEIHLNRALAVDRERDACELGVGHNPGVGRKPGWLALK